jgi:shikimate kinase
MGSGKSSVGRCLAKSLGWPYLDNDVLLAERTGQWVDQVANAGVEPLHALERDLLEAAVLRKPPFVAGVAASVGDRPDELEELRACGFVVYLRATVDTLAARVGDGKDRPWLVGHPRTVIGELLARRASTYESGADVIIDTDAVTTEQVAEQIIKLLALD